MTAFELKIRQAALRNRNLTSMRALSRALGMETAKSLHNWLKCKNRPSKRNLVALAQAIGETAETVQGWIEENAAHKNDGGFGE